MLTIINQLPAGLLTVQPASLHRMLSGPTLIHLDGARPEPLFVSILLHGNEDTGLIAIQRVLDRYRNAPLPRALSIFIGNVSAAAEGRRFLPGQPDYNRIWPGTDQPATPEQAMMARVVEEMRLRRVFASIDVHNNTGVNPHYGCVNELRPDFLHLVRLFDRLVVYFRRPLGVQSAAFARLCPAVTIECGRPGSDRGSEHAARFIDRVLQLDGLDSSPEVATDIDLYHTVATLRIPSSVSFDVGGEGADLNLEPGLDRMNFRDIEPGTRLARVAAHCRHPVDVIDETGRPVHEQYLERRNGNLLVQRTVTPAMLTLDRQVIRQDCLGYLMERWPISAGEPMAAAPPASGRSQ